MTTIVNNPSRNSDTGGYGLLIGIIAIFVFGVLFVFYIVPALRNMGPAQVTVPTEINVPENVKVNVE